MSLNHPEEKTVAIIGAGPAGLVSARWLLARGFEPIIFESSDDLGGQWNSASERSATWPGMVTNTSRIMTAFSDLDYREGTATYPSRDEVQGYLTAYASKFDLLRRIRFGCSIQRVEKLTASHWRVSWVDNQTEKSEKRLLRLGSRQRQNNVAEFERIVIATGRQNEASIPDLPGLSGFSGRFGVAHTSKYGGSEAYRGATVVIGGCSISALEIATDLAHAGVRVITSFRRQRYVLPKLQSGVPTEHVMFTRAAALAAERLPEEASAMGLKEKILSVSGAPDLWGAQIPDPDVRIAGITQAQGFLPCVAEGRIKTVGWFDHIDGKHVVFKDGSEVEADAILFGTGFKMSLPFLDSAVAQSLKIDDQGLELFAETFHPDLPGLAVIGLYNLTGPYFPVLELQARWIADCFSIGEPDREEMRYALESGAYMPVRGTNVPMNAMALMFARKLGVEPDLSEHAELKRALLFGPLSPVSFRLDGRDALASAKERTLAHAAAFGHIRGAEFTPDQSGLSAAIGV
ncbi:MAG: FAD-dependent oxidoreductase [Hyphomonas sp.]|jgi:cation diffusion facilitator CzcD-associated flavoprotein CzcO|nr:FAD-dependent oxidoreductase [Hyphomonas sp.]